MIIGAFTLVMMLFGGGFDYFYIDNIEKGVKNYVIEKSRKKEILADIKASKKFISDYNKGRESQYKTFKKLNISHETTKNQLADLFNKLYEERLIHQEKMVDDRLVITTKIKPEEWHSIMMFSNKSFDKQIEKQQKKREKNKAKAKEIAFLTKTRKAIIENVHDTEKQKLLISILDEMIRSIEELINGSEKLNVKSSIPLTDQYATKDELLQLSKEMNNNRRILFNKIIDFHMISKKNINKNEWYTIMKTFNKELAVSPR